MSSPIQRVRHSASPERAGNVVGPVSHAEAQRDLWEFALPSSHRRTAALHGGGVLEGLTVSATIDAPGITVMPGLALSGDGRLLAVTISDDQKDYRVRLGPASAGNAADGLATVEKDRGVIVPTAGHAGDWHLILEWDEALLTINGAPTYRLTPWLRLESNPVDPAGRWVVLARVSLDKAGGIKDIGPGERKALSSLRDGLSFRRPQRVGDPPSVQDVPAARLGMTTSGNLEVSIRSGASADWTTAITIDGTTGNVGLGSTNTGARLTIDDPTGDTTANTAAFHKAKLGPNWSHIHWGPTGDWYIRSAAGSGKIVLQDSGGNVGIGTSSPNSRLHVAGDVQVDGVVRARGHLSSDGGKGGFVMDRFVNGSGRTLEPGDVVVITRDQRGVADVGNGYIPLLEVELSDEPYDSRVCGIVCEPYESASDGAGSSRPSTDDAGTPTSTCAAALAWHQRRVEDGEHGWMVTLGAFARCKVDADIAPIQAGDLLTVSPTRGYAQKMLDSAAPAGAIVGKALGSLASGKGRVPVLVTLR